MRLLLVEDNEDDVFLTQRAFKAAAPQVEIDTVTLGREAILRVSQQEYDVAVVDFKLPDMDGLELLRRIARPGLPVLMATARGDQKLAVEVLKSGAEDFLVKEEGYLRRLPQAVLGAVRRSRLDKENRRLVAQTARQASLLEAVLTTDPGAVAVFRGPNLRLELGNPSFRALFPGFDEQDPTGKTIDELFPGGREHELRATLDSVLTTGAPIHLREFPLPSVSRGMRYFHVHILPIEDEAQSDERGIVVIGWEVTAEVEARQRIEDLAAQAESGRAWLQTVIDQMPEGVHIAAAPSAEVLLANRAAERVLGPPRESNFAHEDLPERYGITYPNGSPIALEELPLQRAIWRQETVVGEELRHTRADGTIVEILISASPLYDTQGRLVAGVAVFQDISRIREVDRLKDDFISIASHELRTPLTSLRAAGQLLKRRAQTSNFSPQETGLVNTIVQQADRMTRLIEELLDVSRIQGGKLQFRFEEVDLAQLVRESVDIARVGNPNFTFVLASDTPVMVSADTDRLSQVMSNLLDNAVKYSPNNGKAEITVRAEPERGVAVVRVEDNGVGFDPSESERVFERFGRLGNVANHQRGMGLGLFICRQIVEAHGGTIDAESEGPGKGGAFTVTLPLHRE